MRAGAAGYRANLQSTAPTQIPIAVFFMGASVTVYTLGWTGPEAWPGGLSYPSARSNSRPYHHSETAHAVTAGARNHALVEKMADAVMARASN